MRKPFVPLLVLILALAMGASTPRTQVRVDVSPRVVDRLAAGGSVPVVVGVDARFVPEGYLADRDAVASQREGIARVLDDVMTRAAGAGITVGSSYEILPFFTARVDRAALAALAAMPGVVSIAPNEVERAHLLSSVPLINTAPAWGAGHTGAGWTVSVIDTGVENTHSFLAGKVVAEGCYVNAGGAGGGTNTCPGGGLASTAVGSGVPCSVASDCFHGTHVAGIAAGAGGPGSAPNGVAPGASVAAFQVFTVFSDPLDCSPDPAPCTGTFPSDQVLALLRTATLAGPGNANRIAAVNMSLGGGQFFDQATCNAANVSNGRRAAIQNLLSLGIAVVASSGNNGFPTSMGAPACISEAVSVGSVTDALAVSSFSNNASFLSLYGPGSSITSSVLGNAFGTFNGTSMAAPHVAGAWAIVKQAVPAAGVAQVLGAFQATGTTINDQRGGGTPHPLININAARLAVLGGGGGGLPGAPTNFTVVGNGNALSMSWNASADVADRISAAATNYNLIARVVSGGAPVVVQPLGNVTSFAVNAPNGTFFLSVQGTNAAGPGPESNVVQVTVPVLPPPPGSPTNLLVNVVGNSAAFSWTAPTSGGPVGNYVLLASNAPVPAPALVSLPLPPSPTSFAIGGIPPGVWYVRIFARNAGGNSPNSTNEVQLNIAGPQPPGTPTMNTPTVSPGNTVGLSWTPGAGGTPTSYSLIVRLSPAGPVFAQFAFSVTAVSFGGVPSGTYYLQVIASNALGSSGLSNQVTLVVP
jgi:subtilisin family serine protease